MNKNRQCSSFLGVHVAERVLAAVFENIERMPYGNKGFDFICGKGYAVDVKSACRTKHKQRSDRWVFRISKNNIADYFLLIAFDDRTHLNPEHLWLIPGGILKNRVTTSISTTAIDKWNEYEKQLDKVVCCCSNMRTNQRTSS